MLPHTLKLLVFKKQSEKKSTSFLHFKVCLFISFPPFLRGWSGGAKVLGKLSVPVRPTSLDDSRARAYCTCSR